MLASFDANSGRPPDLSKRTDALQCLSMKIQYGGRSKPKWSLRLEPIFDLLNDFVELAKSISCLLPCSFVWIGY
jgi:hypothetical protein